MLRALLSCVSASALLCGAAQAQIFSSAGPLPPGAGARQAPVPGSAAGSLHRNPGAPGGQLMLLGGGSDECSTAQVVTGNATVFFDLTNATFSAEGQVNGACLANTGAYGIEQDVWFAWTPTHSGLATISTCDQDGVRTKLAVFLGPGCPGIQTSSIACNQDGCGSGNQSFVQLAVTAGTTYRVQIGNPINFPDLGTGYLTFHVPGPPLNDDCATPTPISGAGLFEYDSTLATTGSEGQTELLCNFFALTGIASDLWFTCTAEETGTARVSTCSLSSGDTKIAVYPGSGCPTPGSALACNDDDCGLRSLVEFPCVQGQTYSIQIGSYPGAPTGSPGVLRIEVDADPCYALDDGVAETCWGGLPGVVALQGFAAAGGQDEIRIIEAAFGSTQINCGYSPSQLTVAIWDDPTNDFNPTDAVLLWSQTAVSNAAYIGTGDFQLFSVPNVTVTGVYFVGLAFQNLPPGSFPVGVDQSSPGGNHSWWSGSLGPLSLTNLGTNTIPPSPLGSGGTLMLRATGASCLDPCYALDRVSAGTSLGYTASPTDLLSLQGYAAAGGSDTLTQVSTTFGSPMQPSNYTPGPIVIGVWDDPTNDYDPSDAVLLHLQLESSRAECIDTGVFQSFSLPEVPVTGVFFVGVMYDDMPMAQYPIAFDSSTSDGSASWVAFDTALDLNLSNLLDNSNPPAVISSLVSAGAFYIRAAGQGCYGPQPLGTAYCFGDGSGTNCPCNNNGLPGRGCDNLTGSGGARLSASGTASVSAADLVLIGEGSQANQPGVYFQANNRINGGLGTTFFDGLRCAGGALIRMQVRIADAQGASQTTLSIPLAGGVNPGDTKRYQWWYRSVGAANACGSGSNYSNGLEIAWVP